MLGQLKTPGFSEYLHPVDSSTLIGFGTNTTVAENGAVMENGMKLSLFDVSDPLHPKESQVFYLGNQGIAMLNSSYCIRWCFVIQ